MIVQTLALFGVLASAQPTKPQISGSDTAGTIFATIDHSEWCPSGTVFINLATGSYTHASALDQTVCTARTISRRIENKILPPAKLEPIRAAYREAARIGLTSQACRDGKPSEMILSTGGREIMVVTGPFTTEAVPDNLACWSAPASRLHRLLEQTFAG